MDDKNTKIQAGEQKNIENLAREKPYGRSNKRRIQYAYKNHINYNKIIKINYLTVSPVKRYVEKAINGSKNAVLTQTQ